MAAKPWESIQVACAYVGTVVGAGFASGQELHQFFGRHGDLWVTSAALAVILFALIGYRVMMLGNRLQAQSYVDASRHLFGPKFGAVVNVSINVMMLGITVAMLAGSGALFEERMDVPFTYGALFTALLTFLTLLYGLRGLLRINTLIVPMMLIFLCIVCYRVILLHPVAHPSEVLHSLLAMHLSVVVSATVSALVYVALNVGLAVGVLIPVGGSVRDKETLRFGAILGALALGVMMMAVLAALERVPGALDNSIPMAYIAGQYGPIFSKCFVVVLFGEIFSTLVGNLFTLVTQIPPKLMRFRNRILAALLLIAVACSHVGFSSIVQYGYTFFGWLSTAFLIALLWPRSARTK